MADTHTLEIVKHSEAISWGAVFADFCQAIAKVQDQACGMHIRREIIPSSPELHVGDRIKVVLTYTCDRDYDMVQVLDAKAACMEPVTQLAWSDSFKHVSPRDTCTEYYYHGLAKGQHSHVTEFVLDRPGTYALGTAQIKCLYAPEFNALCASEKITVLP